MDALSQIFEAAAATAGAAATAAAVAPVAVPVHQQRSHAKRALPTIREQQGSAKAAKKQTNKAEQPNHGHSHMHCRIASPRRTHRDEHKVGDPVERRLGVRRRRRVARLSKEGKETNEVSTQAMSSVTQAG